VRDFPCAGIQPPNDALPGATGLGRRLAMLCRRDIVVLVDSRFGTARCGRRASFLGATRSHGAPCLATVDEIENAL